MNYTPGHLKLWTLPQCYAGAHWNGFYVFLSQHRDSGALDRANFDTAWNIVVKAMSKDSIPGDADDCATCVRVRENHWAVGWVEWIAIHESDTEALKAADAAMVRLENYPVLDEELFSQYETDEADTVWRDCYRPKERAEYVRRHRSQFEFRDFADMLNCLRGKYFAGYASELLN